MAKASRQAAAPVADTRDERLKAYRESYRTFFWVPYPWQDRLLSSVRGKSTVAAISSNKIGKCLAYGSKIDTPDGEVPIGVLFERGRPFDVFAWDGEKKVVVKAHAPFKKDGLHDCYRIVMSDGRWFEGADRHRILTTSGDYISLDTLRDFFHESLVGIGILDNAIGSSRSSLPGKGAVSHSTPECLQIPARTISDVSPSVHPSGVAHSHKTPSGYPGDYSECSCRYGGRPRFAQDSDPVFLPSRDDFQGCTPSWLNGGGSGRIYNRILSSRCAPLYRLRQFWGRLFEFLNQNVCTSYLPLTSGPQGFQLPCTVAFSGFQPDHEAFPHSRNTAPSYSPPLCIDGNKPISSNFIGCQEVYDFTVPKYHNYFAGGLIHHNTAAVVNILLSWLFGFEPWTVDYQGPDRVFGPDGKTYYRRSSLGIAPPVSLMLTGEDWKAHIGRVLIPELKKWAPQGWYTTKRNEQGVEYYWEFVNKSTLTIMSYSQDDDLFESFRVQGVVMDEPPPKSKYAAMSRGLLLDRGKTLLSLTPLKEAWILDEIVLSGRRDIGIVDGLDIRDNPDLYNSDLELLGELGLTEEQKMAYFDLLLYENAGKKTPVTDRGHAAMVYLEHLLPVGVQERISELKIHKFIADIDPSDVPPRVFGQFKSLVGRVLKEFDDNVHVVNPFDVPTDWPVTVMIDFHLSTPQAVSYWTVNRQDIHFCIAETWKNMNADEIADDIIRKVRGYGWNIENAYIDPLSKGDTAYMKNMIGTDIRSTFNILDERLSAAGITLQVASKDKESGIKNIQTWLKGPNNMPTCYIFDTCERHIFEVKRWVFDDDGKPIKENDHFMENWYRYTLTGARFEDHRIEPLPQRRMVGAANWMGA